MRGFRSKGQEQKAGTIKQDSSEMANEWNGVAPLDRTRRCVGQMMLVVALTLLVGLKDQLHSE